MASCENKVNGNMTPELQKSELPPCMVCGGDSSGYHFGAVTCESCKVFFRRSLLRKPLYKCIKEGECVIRPVKKKNCSACRLKKCIEIGMSKEGVKKGRYSIARKFDYLTMTTEAELEKVEKELESTLRQQEIIDTVDRLYALHLKYPTGTKESFEILKSMVEEKVAYYQTMEELIGPTTPPTIEEVLECYKNTGVDLSGLSQGMKRCLQCHVVSTEQYINYVKDLDEFMELSLHDRIASLKGAFHEWAFVSGFHWVNAKKGIIMCPLCGNYLMENDIDVLKNCKEIKSMFLHCKIMQEQSLKADEIAVLRALVLFDTSHPVSIQPENPDQFNTSQTHFLNCFLHVLQRNRGPENASKIYCNVVRALTVGRSIQYIASCLRQDAKDIFFLSKSAADHGRSLEFA